MNRFENFMVDWTVDSIGIKPVFQALHADLLKREHVALEWVHRPGVSYSLRASHVYRKKAKLFVMVDVIDDDPEQRWLSVCFHKDMIQDPEGRGDLAPGGLLGTDGYCFDISEPDEALRDYVMLRIGEAYETARGGK